MGADNIVRALQNKSVMKKPSNKMLLAVAIGGTLLGTALYASAGCWVHTSCGKVVMTISEKGAQGYMTDAEYDEYLRDLNKVCCGTRERPNLSHVE